MPTPSPDVTPARAQAAEQPTSPSATRRRRLKSWRAVVRVVAGAVSAVGIAVLSWRHGLQDALGAAMSWAADHPALLAAVVAGVVLVWAAAPRPWLGRARRVAADHPVTAAAVAAALIGGTAVAAWVFDRTSGSAVTTGVAGQRLSPAAASVQAGVLFAGVVAAATSLWFNDQRRRREDETLRNEADRLGREALRLERDKQREEEERFIKAVELTGHVGPGVRIGAFHSLVGLAHVNPERTQTVVDVLAAYLRQPFRPVGPVAEAAAEGTPAEGDAADSSERERHVREAAQTLLFSVLPGATLPQQEMQGGPILVDLTGARLGPVRVEAKRAAVKAAGARIDGGLIFSHCALVNLDLNDAVAEHVEFDRSDVDTTVRLYKLRAKRLIINGGHIGSVHMSLPDGGRAADIGDIRVRGCTIGYFDLPREVDVVEIDTARFTSLCLRSRIRRRLALWQVDGGSDADLSGMVFDGDPENFSVDGLIAREKPRPPRGWEWDPSPGGRGVRPRQG